MIGQSFTDMGARSHQRRRVSTARGHAVGFVSVPTPEFDEREVDLPSAVEAKIRRVGIVAGQRYAVEFMHGHDASTAGSDDVRRFIHRALVRRVDFLVVVLDRPSEGCMRIIGWAAALGIPTFVAQLPEARQSALVGRAAGEGPLTVRFSSDLRDVLLSIGAWQRQSAALILGGEARRATAGAEHDSERRAAAARWNAAGDATRDTVAAALALPRMEVVELLGDSLLFAAASPYTRRMVAEVLTRAVPETPAGAVAQDGDQAEVPGLDVTRLPATFFSSFREALAEYGVDASRESEVLLEGLVHEQKRRAAELVGEPLRLPTLTNVPAWGPIVEKALGD